MVQENRGGTTITKTKGSMKEKGHGLLWWLCVPRHFEVAAYCKKTANYFLYFTDDTYKSVLFTTACSFLFYQSNRLDKGGVPGVREAQGRNRLCSRLD